MKSLGTLSASAVAALAAGSGLLLAQVEIDTLSNFNTGFEVEEGYLPGILLNDPIWTIGGDSQPEVGSFFYSGIYGLNLDNGDTISVDFTSLEAPGVGWVDLYLKPTFERPEVLPVEFPLGQAALTGFVKVDLAGEVYVLHGDGMGNGEWIGTGYSVVLNGSDALNWLRMTYRLDYNTQNWDLYLDDALHMIDIGFVDASAPPLSSFLLQSGDEGATHFDDFSAGFINPLFTDEDNDGIDDAYEIAEGMDVSSNDREGDLDFDNIVNVLEFMNGLKAGDPDTDGDGVDDGAELLAGADPSSSDVYDLESVPYSEGFEAYAEGDLTAQSFWQVSGGSALVQSVESIEGVQALELQVGETTLELENTFDGSDHSKVWVDLKIQPVRFKDQWLDDINEYISPEAAAAFFFIEDDQIAVLDGYGNGIGGWTILDHLPVGPEGWARVTVRKDYASQTFELWLDGIYLGGPYGFANQQPYFSHLSIKQDNSASAYLDDVYVSNQRPTGLDTDGDGLLDEEEDVNGNEIVDPGESDPYLVDTDGDGRSDAAAEVLQLWLKADAGVQADSNGVLSQWDDQSIFKQHALASGGSTEAPVLIEDFANGQPAVQFDGQDDFLLGASSFDINNSDYTLVVVQRRNGGDNRGGLLSYANEANTATVLRWGQGQGDLGVYKGVGDGLALEIDMADRAEELLVVSARRSGGTPTGNGDTIDLRVLAEESTWAVSDAQGWQSKDTASYLLGKIKEGNPNHFGGEILEIRTYKGALSDEEVQGLESELALKYGLNLDQNANSIPDGWESIYFGRLLATDEELLDPDGDGVNTFREFNLGLDPNVADNITFPLNDLNLKVWLSADEGITTDTNGDVVQWDDRSGNSIEVLPDTGTNSPIFETAGFNGKPSVYFDGSEALVAATPRFDLADHDYTIVAVHSEDDSVNGEQSLISFRRQQPEVDAPSLGWLNATEIGEIVTAGSGQAVTATVSGVDGGIGSVSSIRRSGDMVTVDHDGYTGFYSNSGLRAPGAKGSTGFFLGTEKPNGGQELNGRISEILVFDRSLSDAELGELFINLREQYGIVDDIDGDGLLNLEEDLNGNGIVDAGESSPFSNDSDGDGLLDTYDPQWIADPIADAAALEVQPDGSLMTRFSFDAADGYQTGSLGGQQGWEAAPIFRVSSDDAAAGTDQSLTLRQVPFDRETYSPNNNFTAARHYLDASGESIVWVSFLAKLQPAVLSEIDFSSAPAVALALSAEETVAVYDSALGDWREVPGAVSPDAWVRYDLELDYTNKVWKLCIEGQSLFADIPFVDTDRSSLEYFALLQHSGSGSNSWIDEIVISNVEPAGLDFDGDGLDNATERQLGSNLNLADTDNDGLDDFYEYTNDLDLLSYDVGGADGVVRRDVWTDITGESLSVLTENTNYPTNPDLQFLSLDLDIQDNESVGDHYGQRIYGLIVAPETAEYTFWMAGDDYCEFWLSDDDTALGKSRLCYLDGATHYQEWDRTIEQQSVSILLKEGQAYYFEIIQKENEGLSHVTIAWEYSDNDRHVITSEHLRMYAVSGDADRDGLPDDWELANGLDPTTGYGANGYAGDLDGDGILNHQEYESGTNANSVDTDGDGISDYDELTSYQSDPTVSDVGAEEYRQSIDLSSGTGLLGEWLQDANGVHSNSAGGVYRQPVTIGADGFYELEFVATRHQYNGSLSTYEVGVTVDGQFIEYMNFEIPLGESNVRKIVLPWLKAGAHEIDLKFINFKQSRNIQFTSMALVRHGGADLNANGIPDWIDARVHSLNGIETLNVTSVTSPACVEGRSRYIEMLSVNGQAAQAAPADRWFANIALDPLVPTDVSVSFENGGLTQSHSITWAQTNVIESDGATLRIRKDDALLLNAHSAAATAGTVTFTVNGQVLPATTVAAPIPLTFDLAGSYTIIGTWVDGSSSGSGTIQVDVIEASFAESPVAMVGQRRNWINPDMPLGVYIEADGRNYLHESEDSVAGARSFDLIIDSLEPRFVAARVTADGPILAVEQIRSLRVAKSTAVSFELIESYEDGAKLYEMGVVLTDVYPDVQVEVDIFVGGVIFEDGTTYKMLTADDFNVLGLAHVRFIRSASAVTSTCHRSRVFDDELVIGTPRG